MSHERSTGHWHRIVVMAVAPAALVVMIVLGVWTGLDRPAGGVDRFGLPGSRKPSPAGSTRRSPSDVTAQCGVAVWVVIVCDASGAEMFEPLAAEILNRP